MNDNKWSQFKNAFPIGSIVCGVITQRRQHGFFVNLPLEQQGHVDIINYRDELTVKDLNDFPLEGTACTALILAFSERQKQVGLDTRPFQKFAQGDPISVDVGLRTNAEGTLEYFGVSVVNAYLQRSMQVLSLKEGNAYFEKIAETDTDSGLVLTGCSVTVTFSGIEKRE